jgi:hypothetical protein
LELLRMGAIAPENVELKIERNKNTYKRYI